MAGVVEVRVGEALKAGQTIRELGVLASSASGRTRVARVCIEVGSVGAYTIGLAYVHKWIGTITSVVNDDPERVDIALSAAHRVTTGTRFEAAVSL